MPGIGIAPARSYADGRAHRGDPALGEGASRARSLWFIPALSGGVAGTTSVGRLWLANPEVLGQVLWAEDGLFPLCAMQSGFLTCLFEPFAGYLLFAPRVIAGLVALAPLVDWAAFANGIAAALAVIVSFTVTWHLMGQRFGKVASFARHLTYLADCGSHHHHSAHDSFSRRGRIHRGTYAPSIMD